MSLIGQAGPLCPFLHIPALIPGRLPFLAFKVCSLLSMTCDLKEEASDTSLRIALFTFSAAVVSCIPVGDCFRFILACRKGQIYCSLSTVVARCTLRKSCQTVLICFVLEAPQDNAGHASSYLITHLAMTHRLLRPVHLLSSTYCSISTPWNQCHQIARCCSRAGLCRAAAADSPETEQHCPASFAGLAGPKQSTRTSLVRQTPPGKWRRTHVGLKLLRPSIMTTRQYCMVHCWSGGKLDSLHACR